MKKNSLISLLIILVIAIFSAVIILNFSKSEKQGVNLGSSLVKNAQENKNLNNNISDYYNLLSFFLIKNNDNLEIKKISSAGVNTIFSYSQPSLSKKSINPLILSGQKLIYLNRLGERDYLVIDYNGKDQIEALPYLFNKNFLIYNFLKFPNEEKIIYSIEGGIPQREKNKVLYIQDFQGNILDDIESNLLPNSLESSRPIGWSKDKKYLYVTKIGWEGFTFAGLWKVDMETEAVEAITDSDKIVLGDLSVVPEFDLAVGIASQAVYCEKCMAHTKAGPPSQMMLFDLKNNNSKILLTDNETLLRNPVLSPDGTKIFYDKYFSDEQIEKYQYVLTTNKNEKIGEDFSIEGMSADGNIIIGYFENTSDNLIINLLTDSRQNLNETGGNENINFIKCNYPLGFSCLYDLEVISISDWLIYRYPDAKNGFEFKYPREWRITTNDAEGGDYKVMTKVVNPERAGVPQTDVPIEQFLVRSLKNLTCEGEPIMLGSKVGKDSGWNQGYGLIYYRGVCFEEKENDWLTAITLSAYDELSKAVMDKILSTFKFY